MIMIPDPQSYIKFASNQPIFELQTAWAAQNIDNLNIKAVLFTGDMVEQTGQLTAGDPKHFHNGDQTSRQQWQAVSKALERLDNKVPYLVAQGNHDVGFVAAENRYTIAPEFIYPERNSKILDHLVSNYTNVDGVPTLENSAYEFNDKVWGNILFIVFEFAPRDETLDWAKNLISSKRFANHRVFILTHSFLSTTGDIIKKEGYKLTNVNWPEAVWRKLVYPSTNIQMVLCGHTGVTPEIKQGDDVVDIDYSPTTAFRVDKAADGHEVAQMMFNSQQGDGSWFGNGGDGWLRILEFKPDGKTIAVRTFSPLFALSRITAPLAWRKAEYDQFEIILCER